MLFADDCRGHLASFEQQIAVSFSGNRRLTRRQVFFIYCEQREAAGSTDTQRGKTMSESTLWDLTIPVENQPGTMARIIEVLEVAHIPFEGLTGFGTDTHGELHLLVVDKMKTVTALEKEGFKVTRQHEAVCEEVKDYPPRARSVCGSTCHC